MSRAPGVACAAGARTASLARSLVCASGRAFHVKGYREMGIKDIGALVVMEACKPHKLCGSWPEACTRIAGAILGCELGTDTARLSFEPDKVEWVVLVTKQQLEGGIWSEFDKMLANIVQEACS